MMSESRQLEVAGTSRADPDEEPLLILLSSLDKPASDD
jgi:hypothetical protein